MKSKTNGWIYWTPRILAILLILFLALFSLDVFDMNLGFWETATGLLIHNIPSLVLLIVLAIAWKYEIVGGVVFTLSGISFVVLHIFRLRDVAPHAGILDCVLPIVMIAGPAFLIGILFAVGWCRKRAKGRIALTDR